MKSMKIIKSLTGYKLDEHGPLDNCRRFVVNSPMKSCLNGNKKYIFLKIGYTYTLTLHVHVYMIS